MDVLKQNKITKYQIELQTVAQNNLIFELLVSCSQIGLNRATQEKIEILLQQTIDWKKLIETASKHGVVPLLYCSLKNNNNIPKDILYQLKSRFFDNLRKNSLLTRELNEVLNLFKQTKIPAVPFKGPVLAISAYRNLSLREFGDLDILVKEEDFIQAKNILIARGYYSTKTWFLNEKQETSFIQNMGEYSLISNDNTVNIDLHSRLDAGYLFTLAADLGFFWKNLQCISILGHTVDTFQPEDNLLYLCIHGTKSFWEKLIWICDVAESIKSNPHLDWEYLLKQSQTIGCQRMLLLGCHLANNLLATELPLDIITKINRDLQIKCLSSIVKQKLKGEIEYPCVDEYTLASLLFYLRAVDKLKDKLIYILRYLLFNVLYPVYAIFRPTASDRDFIGLNRNFYFLYYLIKPIRLMRQYWIK